jgi:hypothetical protein
MDRFDDVSVVTSIDESPPPRKLPRRTRRAFTATVASIVVAGALVGAAVGLADEKSEPTASSATEGPVIQRSGHHPCHRGEHFGRPAASSSSSNY